MAASDPSLPGQVCCGKAVQHAFGTNEFPTKPSQGFEFLLYRKTSKGVAAFPAAVGMTREVDRSRVHQPGCTSP